MFRSSSIALLAGVLAAAVAAGPAAAKEKEKKSSFQGCPAGLTFSPDLYKNISWARSAFGYPGAGYRPPKEWKCK